MFENASPGDCAMNQVEIKAATVPAKRDQAESLLALFLIHQRIEHHDNDPERRQDQLRQECGCNPLLEESGAFAPGTWSLPHHLARHLREWSQRSLHRRINRRQPKNRRNAHHQAMTAHGQTAAFSKPNVGHAIVYGMRDLAVENSLDTSTADNTRSRSRRLPRECHKSALAWNAPLNTRNSPMKPLIRGSPTDASTIKR